MDVLVLLRHGKSDWSVPAPDHDRPLAPRGRRQAAEAGAWLAEHGPWPDLVVVSPARRARDTWALASDAYPEPPPSSLDPRVYTFDADGLRAVLADPEIARHRCVALVGHEPALGELASDLVGHDVAMPTSALAVVALRPGSRSRLIAQGRPPPYEPIEGAAHPTDDHPPREQP